ICLHVLITGSLRHFRRKCRCGWLLVPAYLLEVVTNILLVKRFLRLPRPVMVRGPEARGIGSKYLVGQYEALCGPAELKFGVGNDDAAISGVSCRLAINLQT